MRAWLAMLGWGVVAAALAQPAADWRLMEEDPSVPAAVWLRDRPDGVPAFRATTVIDARLSSLAAVLLDETRTAEWVYRAREATLLQRDGPARGVTRVVTRMPFPLADRESVVAWEMVQDDRTLAVTMSGHDAGDAWPADPQRVRMTAFESSWTLQPRADGRVDVAFEGYGDPGGSLSSPLLRLFVGAAVWQGPWETVKALHAIVRRPPFPDATLPFVREPPR